MANEVILADRTTTYTVDVNDTVYLDRDASIVVMGANGIRSANSLSANSTLVLDGSVVAVSALSSAILLSGVDAFGLGGHEVTIGETGSVRATGASGISINGSDNRVTNLGSVSGFENGVRFAGAKATLINSGTIYGTNRGVLGEGANNTILNSGKILSDGNGIVSGGSGDKILNSGEISAKAIGISLTASEESSIVNTGHLDAGDKGIFILGGTASFNTVMNRGWLTALGNGIHVSGGSALVRNSGVIETDATAIIATDSFSRITNSGDISAGQDGIDSDGGRLVNSGDITARDTGINLRSTGSVFNDGTILGDFGVNLLGDLSQLENTGTIIGLASGVVGLGNGQTYTNAGMISGRLAMQIYGDDAVVVNTGQIVGGIDAGLFVETLTATVTNSGSISGGTSGITLVGAEGSLITSGRIDGAGVGLLMNGGKGHFALSVTEDGAITGGETAISATNKRVHLVNHGDIQSNSGTAIALHDAADLIRNFGTISAGTADIAGTPVQALAVEMDAGDDRLVNRGTIAGGVDMGSGADTLRNFGVIDGLIFLGDGADLADLRLGLTSERINADAGNDTVFGGTLAEIIDGGADTDRISAGAGNDTLIGGLGQDSLSGGADADVFLLRSAAESGVGALADRITDFTAGTDDLELRSFMGGGSFIGAAAFGGIARQVRYIAATGVIQGDVDGNGVADWEIVLTNKAAVTAADFLF